MRYPQQITDLIENLAKLPGLGRKSATRLAFHILKRPTSEIAALASALLAVKREIHFCSVCHDYTDQDPCSLCSDPKRDSTVICVVESPNDLLAIESSGIFKGRYHVLGGAISPLSGIGPADLYLDDLIARVKNPLPDGSKIQEVLLATGSSPDGEATCSYLLDLLKDIPVKVTKLARGLPVGMDLEFVDQGSLKEALEFRRKI
ncbi:MAG: recombination mediator RecR [Deltaproteobacteria bacterium]|jgi:recombination protein RecR|nr:recombination mediator RecR [Deltaproteobacteria bacterium]